jgi:hypothetical protein
MELARRHPERAAKAAEPGWLTPIGPDEIRSALAWTSRTLRDGGAPVAQRALALSWLLHLVGDAHQPLHAVALFTAGRFQWGDRGGNEIAVSGQGPLHRVWDALLGDESDAASSYDAVSAQVERWRVPALTSLQKARRELDLELWLDEDCALARRDVYTPAVLAEVQRFESRRAEAAPTPRLKPDEAKPDEAKPEVALDTAYRQQATRAAERRAVQAGARLAALMQRLWKGPAQFKSEGLRPAP